MKRSRKCEMIVIIMRINLNFAERTQKRMTFPVWSEFPLPNKHKNVFRQRIGCCNEAGTWKLEMLQAMNLTYPRLQCLFSPWNKISLMEKANWDGCDIFVKRFYTLTRIWHLHIKPMSINLVHCPTFVISSCHHVWRAIRNIDLCMLNVQQHWIFLKCSIISVV